MKKIVALTAILLSFSATSFAASIASNALIGDATAGTGGLAVFGGVDATAAQNAAAPLVRMSTGVQGVINYDNTTHAEYAVGTKHVSGSKYFGTSNDSTNMYWLQSTRGNLAPATFGTATNNTNFVGGGWTAY